MIPDFLIEERLKSFLEEDLFYGDVTPILNKRIKAKIISKDRGVLAGVRVARIAFDMFDVDVTFSMRDGDTIEFGDVVMEVEGNSRDVLMVERTVLNVLMRMSGVASVTAEMVKRAKKVNPKVVIASTRKTTPGFRIFEKMAVEIGGGDPHRFGLGDCVLIKDNHVAVFGDLIKAIRTAKSVSFTKKIEVEISNAQDALLAVREGVDAILLDNLTPDEIIGVVYLLEKEGLRESVVVEASGGINPNNVEDYARTGVDVISSGYITHSSKAIDMTLKVG